MPVLNPLAWPPMIGWSTPAGSGLPDRTEAIDDEVVADVAPAVHSHVGVVDGAEEVVDLVLGVVVGGYRVVDHDGLHVVGGAGAVFAAAGAVGPAVGRPCGSGHDRGAFAEDGLLAAGHLRPVRRAGLDSDGVDVGKERRLDRPVRAGDAADLNLVGPRRRPVSGRRPSSRRSAVRRALRSLRPRDRGLRSTGHRFGT